MPCASLVLTPPSIQQTMPSASLVLTFPSIQRTMPPASLVFSALLGPEASATERAACRRWPECCHRQVSFAKPRTIKVRCRGPRQDTVPFLSCPEEQKLRFQGEKPLRCASRLLPPGSRKVAGPVSAPPVPAPSLWP